MSSNELWIRVQGLWERHQPFLLGSVAAYLVLFFQLKLPDQPHDLLGTTINVTGVALAFIATLQGFLLSMDQNPIVVRLKEMNFFALFMCYCSGAIHWCFALLIYCTVGYFLKLDGQSPWDLIWFAGWSFIAVASFVACYRITYLFNKLVNR